MLRKIYLLLLTTFFLGLAACTQEAVQTPTPTELANLTATQSSKIEFTPEIEGTIDPVVKTTPLGIKPAALEGLNIQFWNPWMKDAEINEIINQFNRENPYGIEVIGKSLGSNLYQEIQSGINTGSLPDIVAAPMDQIVSWDDYGHIIIPLDSYIQDPEWGLREEDISDYHSGLWEQGVIHGLRLGIPGISASSLLVYNQSWADELGFDTPPTTPEEFKAQACAAAADSIADQNLAVFSGGWIANTDPSTMLSWIQTYGGNVVNDTVDGYALNTLAAKSAFDFVKGLFKSGCAWVPDSPYPDPEFASRGGLFYSTSINGLPYITSAFKAAGNTDKWIAIPYPSSDDAPVMILQTSSYAVIRSTPQKQVAAWVFINWLNQPENQASLVETTDALPSRKSTLAFLGDYVDKHHPWSTALDLVQYGLNEPHLGTWSIVRWAISDAASALIAPGFSDEEIPALLEELNNLVSETHFQNP